ncbi:hypothetical protein O3G_MSEX011718 [Manduca sexta]|uniref:Uncharacterized protein n=1 Tax=Manduca sexta TaxID=7130 RepID=A0A921ZL20_MANSE|nr:hypothetical protein O3G_MSEX011718 [Manduca sexta]
MRGGVDKGLCLLALLFVCSRAEDTVSSEDLKTGLPEEDSKSAALAQSSAYSDSGSSEVDDETIRGSKSAASAGAYANGGQASAQANALSSLRENSLRPGLISPGLGSNSVLAEAIAQASGGLNGHQPLPYQPGYDLNPYGSSAQAQAEAQAVANSGIGGGSLIGPSYVPGNSYPLTSGSSSAQAKAEAQALVNNAGGSGLYPGLNYLQAPGVSTAQAQAEAQAISNAGAYGPVIYKGGYPQQPYQPNYLGQGSSALAQAQAQADALSQISGGNLVGPSYPGYQYPSTVALGINSASAQADTHAMPGGYGYGSGASAQAQANANAPSSAMATADAYSRVIPRHEYIMPHLIPGAEETILCTKEGELHYFWSSAYQCMVCTCINNLGRLSPVCARCDGCMTPVPGPVPGPVPVPEPEPIPYPVTVAPYPPPLPQVSCSPLPSGQPFQNPLNPCQICICRETVTWQGEPDVHIECQQNPECIIPPDVTTLPPLPDVPVPVPLPVCDKFPPNVLFPHPSDVCKVCKCIVEPLGLGILEPKIVCMTLPECLPKPLPPLPTPPPEPVTLPPIPVPSPPEPIPWPPVTPAPIPGPAPGPHPGPGPLPGPAPHESCRPFPPNNPFQHPWDECQVCVCTEAYSYGRITIEVNCYTKKSCCYEPPYPEPVTVAPGPYNPNPPIQIIDKICEYRSYGVEFLNPADKCSVCVCELQGNLVTSVCRRSQAPECVIVYYPGGGGSTAEAQASSSAQTGSLPSSYSPIINLLPSGGQSQASAEANAVVQSSIQSGLHPGVTSLPKPWQLPGYQALQPGVQPWLQPSQIGQYYPVPGPDYVQPGGSQASASAIAEAQANQYQAANIGSLSINKFQPGVQGHSLIPWSSNPISVAEAEASAQANAIQGYQPPLYLNNIGNSPKQLPYYFGNNQLGLGVQLPSYNTPLASPAYGQLAGGGIRGGSSALAEAEALANVLSGNYGLLGGIGQGGSASVEAKANTQAGSSLLSGGGGLYPGGSPLYQTPYFKQGYQAASASSQAQASASGGLSQALASAASGVRKQGKSAQEDMESSEDGTVE